MWCGGNSGYYASQIKYEFAAGTTAPPLNGKVKIVQTLYLERQKKMAGLKGTNFIKKKTLNSFLPFQLLIKSSTIPAQFEITSKSVRLDA